jgi:hypothetical protein
MFVLQLITLIIFQRMVNGPTAYSVSIVALGFNVYFILYELLQILVQKKAYFTDIINLIDITRIGCIYIFIMAKQFGGKAPEGIVPIMFFLLWVKIFKYLSVFSPFRFFIMMLQCIIADIRTFIALLFIAMFAYGQIMYTLADDDEEPDMMSDFRSGYVLAFGELGDFAKYSYIKFFMFFMFTFLIPLTLMNMLVAIMSDTYARV